MTNKQQHKENKTMDTKYNHALGVSFSIVSNDPDGKDITPAMVRQAIFKRMQQLDNCDDVEWLEATLPPYDTYEE
tara:strand:- start:334 stop:558 length:225 start_codon:yes stop_codon:yes gene_type:complete